MLEGQLTWLVHIIGAVVRGRMNTAGLCMGGVLMFVFVCAVRFVRLHRHLTMAQCAARLRLIAQSHHSSSLPSRAPPDCATPLFRRRCARNDGRRPGGASVWPAAAGGYRVSHNAVSTRN